ncbi:MAG TPA: hypothetical protein DCE41_28490 [Cytophagales bacterium]|nr:hypothetical protein [Cytophagales bacterium]HAP58850.1 hypothetical protein [Cytophagales bacterium]
MKRTVRDSEIKARAKSVLPPIYKGESQDNPKLIIGENKVGFWFWLKEKALPLTQTIAGISTVLGIFIALRQYKLVDTTQQLSNDKTKYQKSIAALRDTIIWLENEKLTNQLKIKELNREYKNLAISYSRDIKNFELTTEQLDSLQKFNQRIKEWTQAVNPTFLNGSFSQPDTGIWRGYTVYPAIFSKNDSVSTYAYRVEVYDSVRQEFLLMESLENIYDHLKTYGQDIYHNEQLRPTTKVSLQLITPSYTQEKLAKRWLEIISRRLKAFGMYPREGQKMIESHLISPFDNLTLTLHIYSNSQYD